MEELRPAKEVIEDLEIKPSSRLLFAGDVTFYAKAIQEAASPPKKPFFRSLSLPIPLPANSVDLVFIWLMGRAISVKALSAEITKICSEKGAIWIAMLNEEDIPLGVAGREEVEKSMQNYGWHTNKEIKLGRDYYAIRFQPNPAH